MKMSAQMIANHMHLTRQETQIPKGHYFLAHPAGYLYSANTAEALKVSTRCSVKVFAKSVSRNKLALFTCILKDTHKS